MQQFVSFHIFVETELIPDTVYRNFEQFERSYHCSEIEPYSDDSIAKLVRAKNNLTYPINVARNIARSAALTHFVMADLDLLPSPGIVENFFALVKREPERCQEQNKLVVERK